MKETVSRLVYSASMNHDCLFKYLTTDDTVSTLEEDLEVNVTLSIHTRPLTCVPYTEANVFTPELPKSSFTGK